MKRINSFKYNVNAYFHINFLVKPRPERKQWLEWLNNNYEKLIIIIFQGVILSIDAFKCTCPAIPFFSTVPWTIYSFPSLSFLLLDFCSAITFLLAVALITFWVFLRSLEIPSHEETSGHTLTLMEMNFQCIRFSEHV